MAAELLTLAVIPAAAAVAIAADGSTPSTGQPTKLSPRGEPLIQAGAAHPGGTIDELLRASGGIAVSNAASTSTKASRANAYSSGSIASSNNLLRVAGPLSSRFDQELEEKLALIKKYGQAAYDKLGDDVKKKSAKEISELLKLDPPLTGDESWEDIAKIAGGAAGLAFSPLPGGTVWGPIVGAYLGVKLEELVSKNIDEIETWFEDRWNGITGFVKGIGNDVEDAAQDVIDWVGSIF